MKKKGLLFLITAYLSLTGTLAGCGRQTLPGQESVDLSGGTESTSRPGITDDAPPSSADTLSPLRDSTPLCLVPTAEGTAETRNEAACIDYSNADSGYVMVQYVGDCPKLKLRITGPDQVVYTYDLHKGAYETFPLSSGNGIYEITVYENISGTSYATCLHAQITVSIEDEFSPFLYPNQYVNFTAESKTVQKGAQLAQGAATDLDVVESIYNYITSSISYDYQKASDPPSSYTTDVDAILTSGTGICLDYAAVMAAMLRSQRIPTRLEVGYAQDAYHAWISAYIEDIGWLNGIIEFDGTSWTLVDPTFGANTDDKTLKKFIGDGSNYILQKIY